MFTNFIFSELNHKNQIMKTMETTTSNAEVIVEIPNVSKTDKLIEMNPDINTVVNIEEEQVSTVSKSDRQRKYWIMFWGSQPQTTKDNQTGTANQGSWCPWSYLPGYTPPPPQKPPPLAYKPETRNSFVKLVMSIVFIMIILTALFVLYVLMTALLLIADYGFMCSPCSRQMPCNMVFLFLALAGMSIFSAKITAHFKTEVVLYAILATAAVVFVCVLLACSNFDFTKYLLYVIVISTALAMVMMIILLVKLFTGTMMKPVMIAILVASSVLQCVILTIQLQMILGGRTVELNETDYALGAFMIYTSIIDIFLKMVQIIGIADSM